MVRHTVLGLITMLSSALAVAQPATSRDSFGPGDQEYWVSGSQFIPKNGIPWRRAGPGFWNPVDEESGFAPVNLPTGAQLTELRCFVLDVDATDVYITLNRRAYNRFTNDITTDAIGQVQSSGSPGRVILTASLDETITDRTTLTYNDYELDALALGSNQIYGCRLVFHRQVSPAPATATFGDVPTDHPFFQFIEALGASEITAGCQTSPLLYCPDRPITRGEMAVYLAKALGLQWP